VLRRKRQRGFVKSKRMLSASKKPLRQLRKSVQKRPRKNASARKRKKSSARSVFLRLKRPGKGK